LCAGRRNSPFPPLSVASQALRPAGGPRKKSITEAEPVLGARCFPPPHSDGPRPEHSAGGWIGRSFAEHQGSRAALPHFVHLHRLQLRRRERVLGMKEVGEHYTFENDVFSGSTRARIRRASRFRLPPARARRLSARRASRPLTPSGDVFRTPCCAPSASGGSDGATSSAKLESLVLFLPTFRWRAPVSFVTLLIKNRQRVSYAASPSAGRLFPVDHHGVGRHPRIAWVRTLGQPLALVSRFPHTSFFP